MGGPSTLAVIASPFDAAPVVTFLTLPFDQLIAQYQTQGITFDDSGRAYIATHHRDWDPLNPATTPNDSYVHVLDPPYSAIAFSMVVPVQSGQFQAAEGIAVTQDGSKVLVTSYSQDIFIYDAPHTLLSIPTTLSIPAMACGFGLDITPDQQEAVVVDCLDMIQVVSAPFNSSSSVETISIPAAAQGALLEHVSISADGQLAVVSGGSNGSVVPAVFMEAPFTSAGATLHAVIVTNGRGAGAAEFMRTRIFEDGFESGSTSKWVP